MLGFASCSMTRRPAARSETPRRRRAGYGAMEMGSRQIRGEPPCVMPMPFTEFADFRKWASCHHGLAKILMLDV